MKNILILFIVLILSMPVVAQDIWFIHPENGEIINDSFSENQVAVNNKL